MAVLGTILVLSTRSNVEASLDAAGVPKERADQVADALSHAGGSNAAEFSERAGARARELFEVVQLDYAQSIRTVFYAMASIMALAFVVALVGMRGGRPGAAAQRQAAVDVGRLRRSVGR